MGDGQRTDKFVGANRKAIFSEWVSERVILHWMALMLGPFYNWGWTENSCEL